MQSDIMKFPEILPNFILGNSHHCIYCGEPATCQDHVIPWSYFTSKDRETHSSRNGPRAWACSYCNGSLSDKYFGCLWERIIFINKKLEKQAKPILWSKQELEEIDYSLRIFIRKSIDRLTWFRLRADWFQSRDFYLNLESIVYEPMFQCSTRPKLKEFMNETLKNIKTYLYKY